jgi:hypothetical protein
MVGLFYEKSDALLGEGVVETVVRNVLCCWEMCSGFAGRESFLAE